MRRTRLPKAIGVRANMVIAFALALSCATAASAETIRFAVIGDYGSTAQTVDAKTKKKTCKNCERDEKRVADMVKGWNPSFIITLGDNNYECGAASTIVENIGQYYCDFIYNPGAPAGQQCSGRAATDKTNRFFPTLGNHDWYTPNAAPYLAYFTELPGNRRYYDFVQGPVHFFALDSESKEACADAGEEQGDGGGKTGKCGNPCTYEPDGGDKDSKQARWFEGALKASTSDWNLVFFHRPPYSCSQKTTAEWMRWPFAESGINAVLSGHRHVYERIVRKDRPNFPYFVNGVGGTELSGCKPADVQKNLPPSKFDALNIEGKHGAMLVEASETQITFQFFTVGAKGVKLADTCQLTKTKGGQSLTCSPAKIQPSSQRRSARGSRRQNS